MFMYQSESDNILNHDESVTFQFHLNRALSCEEDFFFFFLFPNVLFTSRH